jgi:monoamine oxidase
MFKIAIVGGGPGGLLTAHNIKKELGNLVQTTLFEASDRLGGKIMTKTFDSGAMYEAGVAEIYGYTSLGHDPLNELIKSFGLETVPMDSDAVMMDRRIHAGVEGIRKAYGTKTAEDILKFRKACTDKMSHGQYYEGIGKHDNDHDWQFENAEELLNEMIEDPDARRYIQTMARSDIASELHHTNGLNALKNFLMDSDGYIDVYSIVGGNEGLINGLKKDMVADVRYNSRVTKIDKVAKRYTVEYTFNHRHVTEHFDAVIICLPFNWLMTLQWGNETLRRAMTKHIAYFDRPAHYLRIVIEFDTPFWEGKVEGAWFMSEAFGGCCVYIEGARHDSKGKGVLNWLVSGGDVLAYANLSDADLFKHAMDTLPEEFGDPRVHFSQGRTHRWLSSVNALPGGSPVRDVMTNHIPEPKEHGGIILTGDYMFDSTVNGLLDSTEIATEIVISELTKSRYLSGESGERAKLLPDYRPLPKPSAKIDRPYFDNYRGRGVYADVWNEFTDVKHLLDIFTLGFGEKPKKLLITGSASGQIVQAFRDLGVDAWGLESSKYIHDKTPEALKKYNKLGSIQDIPYGDEQFDYVYETALAYVNPRFTHKTVAEIHRVSKKGVFFGTITSDLSNQIFDKYDLMRGVKKISTWWEWSEIMIENDFDFAVTDLTLTEVIWQRTREAGKGEGKWYEDAESLKYCFFKRLEIEE